MKTRLRFLVVLAFLPGCAGILGPKTEPAVAPVVVQEPEPALAEGEEAIVEIRFNPNSTGDTALVKEGGTAIWPLSILFGSSQSRGWLTGAFIADRASRLADGAGPAGTDSLWGVCNSAIRSQRVLSIRIIRKPKP